VTDEGGPIVVGHRKNGPRRGQRRKGRVATLGISFELVTSNAAVDRIPPGRTPTAKKNYFK